MNNFRITTNGFYYRVEQFCRCEIRFWRREWVGISKRFATRELAEAWLAEKTATWEPLDD
jgi:hypothetical protein